MSGERLRTTPLKMPAPQTKPGQNQPAREASQPPEELKRVTTPTKAEVAGNKIKVKIRVANSVQLRFPFEKSKVPAAIFQRNENLWILIDSPRKIDLRGLKNSLGGIVSDIRHEKLDKSQLFEFRLSGPWLSSVSQHNANWNISIGDLVTGSSRKIRVQKQRSHKGKQEVLVLVGKKGRLHQIKDIHSGDDLLVVTSPRSGQKHQKKCMRM